VSHIREKHYRAWWHIRKLVQDTLGAAYQLLAAPPLARFREFNGKPVGTRTNANATRHGTTKNRSLDLPRICRCNGMALPTEPTKRLFTGADVATTGVFAAIALLAFRPAVDPDVFWHLATGKWIWRNGSIPKADPFSWTTPGRAWIAHEWLTEAIWHVLYRIGGWGALVAFSGLILLATFALVRATARYLGAGSVSATLFTAVSALAGLHTWNVRPQMISLAFCALFGYWFAKSVVPVHGGSKLPSLETKSPTKSPTRAGFRRSLWAIPVIMLAWVNLHGGWVFGMAMLGAFTVATVLESSRFVSADDGFLQGLLGNRQPLPKAFATAAIGVFLASLVVCFANPNGLKGVVYPFSYLGDNASTRYVNEWFAPSISKVQYWPFFALLALFVASMATGLRKLPLYVYAIGIPFAFLAVQSARNVSQFAVFVAPYLAVAATQRRLSRTSKTGGLVEASPEPPGIEAPERTQAIRTVGAVRGFEEGTSLDSPAVLSHTKTKKPAANPSAISNINRFAIVALIAVSVALGFQNFTKQSNLAAQARIYPVAAVRALLGDPGTRLLNDYDWGGYLTHVAPSIPVSIDGRPDMYGDQFTDGYVAMWRVNQGWQARLSAFDADRLLAKPESAIASKLRKSPDWKITYEDTIAVLFSRK
jgi:hypothetical protein